MVSYVIVVSVFDQQLKRQLCREKIFARNRYEPITCFASFLDILIYLLIKKMKLLKTCLPIFKQHSFLYHLLHSFANLYFFRTIRIKTKE